MEGEDLGHLVICGDVKWTEGRGFLTVILPVSLQPDPCVMNDEGIDTALQMFLTSCPWTDIARKGFQNLQAGDEML